MDLIGQYLAAGIGKLGNRSWLTASGGAVYRDCNADDFMFQLTKEEFDDWRSQIVTSNSSAKMGIRRRPYAFAEQGVAMLSSVLNSERAIEVNVAIMRAFVRLRELLMSHKELARKLDELERKYDENFRVVTRLRLSSSGGFRRLSRTSTWRWAVPDKAHTR